MIVSVLESITFAHYKHISISLSQYHLCNTQWRSSQPQEGGGCLADFVSEFQPLHQTPDGKTIRSLHCLYELTNQVDVLHFGPIFKTFGSGHNYPLLTFQRKIRSAAKEVVEAIRYTNKSSKTLIDLVRTMESVKDEVNNNLLLYQTPDPDSQWVPSTLYKSEDFITSLRLVATDGIAGTQFYIGDGEVENGHVFGLINIAAFLSQSIEETIRHDACESYREILF